MLWTKKHKFPVSLSQSVTIKHQTFYSSMLLLKWLWKKKSKMWFLYSIYKIIYLRVSAICEPWKYSRHWRHCSADPYISHQVVKVWATKPSCLTLCSASFFQAHFWEVDWKLIIRNRTFSYHILELAEQQNHRCGVRKGDWGFLAGKLGSDETTRRNRGYSVFLRSFLIS